MVILRKNVKNEKDEWQTPQWLFDLLNSEFHFDADVAATEGNTKCVMYLDSSLTCEWYINSHKRGTYFMNPPYSGHQIDKFMSKALEESMHGAVVVCLVPVASDTQWWHRNVMKAKEIRFIEGRVDYVGYDKQGKQVKQSPTFPSCVVIFDQRDDISDSILMGQRTPKIGKTIKKPRKSDVSSV
jgi:site-specific DNA-methyltransferase (adenine-specific)